MNQIDTNRTRRALFPCLYTIIFLVAAPNFASAQWIDISPSGFDASQLIFFGVQFRDSENGIAVGQDIATSEGVIARTEDGGESWEIQRQNSQHLRGVGYFTDDEVIVLGYDGPPGTKTLQHSSGDGGKSWQSSESAITSGVNELDILDENTAFAMGYGSSPGFSGGVLRSTDRGQNWTLKLEREAMLFAGQSLVNSQTVFVGATNFSDGSVFKTLDGGETWTEYKLNNWTEDVSFLDANNGYALARSSLYFTSDGGESWTDLQVNETFNRIKFLTVEIGYAVSEDGLAYSTADGGKAWTQMQIDANNALEYLSLQGEWLYSVGRSGQVFRLKVDPLDIETDIAENDLLSTQNEANFTSSFVSMDVTPAPAQGASRVSFQLLTPVASPLRINLLDSRGRKLLTLKDGLLEPGEHQMDLDAALYAPGIYFLQAQSGLKKQVIKFIITH